MSARCRGCAREIRWAETDNGKWIPLDLEPDQERGTIFLIPHPQGLPVPLAVHKTHIDAFPEQADAVFYVPHHATCPDAERFR